MGQNSAIAHGPRVASAHAVIRATRGTVSLARSSLIYEWRRFLPAVLAVTFAALLMMVQLGLLLGMFSTVSVVVDRAHADLWLGFPNTRSFDLGRPVTERHATALHRHPEVRAVEPMIVGYGDWRGPRGNPVSVLIVGFEPSEHSLGAPASFSTALRLALQEPDAVVVDRVDLAKLDARLGEVGEINGARAKIVGLTSGFRNIGGAYVFTSVSTARRMMGPLGMESGFTTYLLAKLHDPERAAEVRAQLQPSGPRPAYTVWTASQFGVGSQLYWLTESGAGASFGFSTLLGLTVGVVITSQTLMAAVIASLREYATLRALGVSRRQLGRVVVEQSFWVGLFGVLAATAAAMALLLLARVNEVGMELPWWGVLATAVISLAAALSSGLLALRALFRAQPAELLR